MAKGKPEQAIFIRPIKIQTTCLNYEELLSEDHLSIGVNFVTNNVRVKKAMGQALDHWTKVLDMEWHEDITGTCALTVIDAPAVAFLFFGADSKPITSMGVRAAAAQTPDQKEFKGAIFINETELAKYDIYTMEKALVHELGHTFGYLDHSHYPDSIMYWRMQNGVAQKLLPQDTKEISRHHRLKR